MRTCLVVLLTLTVHVAIQSETSTQTSAIYGTIVNRSSGAPVAQAGVELMSWPGRKSVSTVAADADGKFVIPNVSPGNYRVAATQFGYLKSEYGQRGQDGQGVAITVTAGQDVKDLRIRLIATGVIYGRILDGRGNPVPDVQVLALKYAYRDGRRVLTPARAVLTNDLGEYRLFWLPPGTYQVSATRMNGAGDDVLLIPYAGGLRYQSVGRAVGTQIVPPDEQVSLPVYFPGTPYANAALSVDVEPGASIGGVNIVVTPVKTYSISGVVRSPSGTDASEISPVRVMPRGETNAALNVSFPNANVNGSTGGFRINGILPGSYYLKTNSIGLLADGPFQGLHGRVDVDVADKDVEDIVINLTRGFEISGRITIDGGSLSQFDVTQLRVRLSLVNTAQPKAETGQFSFSNIGPGAYPVLVDHLPDNAYVQSIRMGSIDVLANNLDINSQPDETIEIRIGMNGAVVDGITLDEKSQIVPNARVVLIPDQPRRDRRDLYEDVFSDGSGNFRFTGVTPGNYKLFAWEDVQTGAWQDPDFMRSFETSGKTIQLVGGPNRAAQLTVIPPR